MLSSVAQADTNLDRLVKRRWVRVVAALFAMVFVSVYEYSWTLYTPGIAKAFHYSTPNAAVIGGIFSVYVVVQAISMWLFGRYSDRHGPRMISILGGPDNGYRLHRQRLRAQHPCPLPDLRLREHRCGHNIRNFYQLSAQVVHGQEEGA
ncbi:hypothetical protein [Thermogymnomonas acidicola]|uniref:hypothetical protein n=1 Tax=Thermogymnomonas acidicola TaxID=399579 RepID=UPI000AA747AF|nr:hypothetical protein [Thermogymnomonas acidicola]